MSLGDPNRVTRRRRARRPSPSRRARPDRGHRRGLPLAGEVAHRASTAAPPLRDDLGEDREGRLGRQAATQVQPDRPAQPVQGLRRHPGSQEPSPPVALGLPRPTAPTYRQPRSSAVTIAGSSNFTSWVSTATASPGPSPISSASSSGQPTISRSTSGKRASVANAARPSITTVSYPRSFARLTRVRATSTAPTTTSRGRTGYASMNSWSPAISTVFEVPVREARRGPRRPAPHRRRRCRACPRAGRRRGRPAARRDRALARRVLAERGRRRVGGEPGHDRATVAASVAGLAGGVQAWSGTAGDTSTSIVPPQARPTSHACSSLIP